MGCAARTHCCHCGGISTIRAWALMTNSCELWIGQMELRYNEAERARGIYERYLRCLPTIKAWVRYAKFEFGAGDPGKARAVYERAVQELDGETGIVSGRPLNLLSDSVCPVRQCSLNCLMLAHLGCKCQYPFMTVYARWI